MDDSPLFADLNPAQREAVAAVDGPILVVAGAGSGKTRVLTFRVAHLIRDLGVSPYALLAITFTNKAADEMKQRVAALVGGVSRGMWVSTFHSACVRILRRDAPMLGYRSNFSIYDDLDSRRAVEYCIRDLGLDPKRFPPKALHAAIGKAKNELIDFESFAAQGSGPYHERVAEVYRLYQQRLLAASAMDFDDLLMVTVELLGAFPQVLEHYQGRFRYLLVDEYQDTNHAQYRLVKMLAAGHRNVCVVGDSDQSIYAFRGADIRNILEFQRDYPDARVVVLDRNYRSTQTILDAANAVISHNLGRQPKHLWTDLGKGDPVTVYRAQDEHDEAAYIAEEVGVLGRCRHPAVGDRRLLSHPRPGPRARRDPGALRGALPGDRRAALLRAARGQRRAGLPAGGGEPGRRGGAEADHQRAQAGDRLHHRGPPRAGGRGGGRGLLRRPGRRRGTTPGWKPGPGGRSPTSSPCSSTWARRRRRGRAPHCRQSSPTPGMRPS